MPRSVSAQISAIAVLCMGTACMAPEGDSRSAEVRLDSWNKIDLGMDDRIDHNTTYQIAATSSDRFVLCAYGLFEGGAVYFGDSDSIARADLPDDFNCRSVVATGPGGLVVYGEIGYAPGTPAVFRYSDGVWSEESVEGLVSEEGEDGHVFSIASADQDGLSLIGYPAYSEWRPDTIAWGYSDGTWTQEGPLASEGFQIDSVSDVFNVGNLILYGFSTDNDPIVASFEMSTLTLSDLGFTATSESIEWAGGSSDSKLYAVDGGALYGYDGESWSAEADCPLESHYWEPCWSTGAVTEGGVVFLGGGKGGIGDHDGENWRLHYLLGRKRTQRHS